MILIGEKINSSRKTINEALSKKDLDFLLAVAKSQIDAGADFIDVNCAVRLDKEQEEFLWLMQKIQDSFNANISIDSPNPDTIKAAMQMHKGKPFINSITAEKEKMEKMLDVVRKKDVNIIALAISDKGVPTTTEERIEIAEFIVEKIEKTGIERENIYVDPLLKPVSSEQDQPAKFLKTVSELKKMGIKTTGGLSNVSYGLPGRRILNAVFLSLCIKAGMDAAILDPTDDYIKNCFEKGVGSSIGDDIFKLAEDALLGRDQYCMNYIKAFRAGKLNG